MINCIQRARLLLAYLTDSGTCCAQGKWNPLHTLALSMQITYMDKLLETLEDIDVVDKVNL